MNVLNKLLIAGLLAGSVAVPVLAADAAQPAPQQKSFHHMDPAQREAMIAKRQQALHDQLKLQPNQEAAWQRYVTAMKPGPRPEKTSREDLAKMTAPDRMALHLQQMKRHEVLMSQRLDATKTFYAQLSSAQKQAFDTATLPAFHHEPAPQAAE